jgi:hypothetical protein
MSSTPASAAHDTSNTPPTDMAARMTTRPVLERPTGEVAGGGAVAGGGCEAKPRVPPGGGVVSGTSVHEPEAAHVDCSAAAPLVDNGTA